ncbi:DinG family ATP-dependent helicase YoaA [Alkalibacterium sp. AK22]|uniref:helicase C-terminal domain-containing protein n=1 Tax=Alkalibacterium sp. AK22 TaxID=1229520 RepID=UPI0004472116|nr:helicase C-terminal domain-containing protein [Alkalibacterium sp. AK22]EXJ22424.1 DinG family ATP-dependent helicase YoaA [Alkalibacterium sp. AK22]
MKKDQLYAVVDIEATGASLGRDERMIQFACVLVKNGEIVETFDTFVNPSRKVNKTIRDLTGITSKDLATAPYFEDIAGLIHQLLEDTIFVAHNVGFDFQFLNECFQRAGISPLTIPALDTVELAQILLPTADSYQLKELTSALGYDLSQAHNALFDAKATVFLLQQLDKKLLTLPLVTLESLAELAPSTTAQTALFFEEALARMQAEPQDLKEDLMIVGGMALKKPQASGEQELHRKLPAYPYQDKDKKRLFDQIGLEQRESQMQMMNDLFRYLKKENPEHSQLMEAAPGAGKTFGYLLPALYLATPQDRIVISTFTKVLQKQLVDEILPLLNSRLPFQKTVALVKSPSHYISLTAFYKKLKTVSARGTEAKFCMKVLVWLTETEEGDLEELGIRTRTPHPFWLDIRPSHRLQPMAAFEETDFLFRRSQRINQASILVTNHAFLARDWLNAERLLSTNKLIVDEAHHLPDVVDETSTVTLKISTLLKELKNLGNVEKEDSLLHQLNTQAVEAVKPYQIQALGMAAQVLLEDWEDWGIQWVEWLISFKDYDPKVIEWKEKTIDLNTLPMTLKKENKRIKTALDELIYVSNQLTSVLEDQPETLSNDSKRLLTRLQGLTDLAQTVSKRLTQLFFVREKGSLTGLRFYSKNPMSTLTFYRFNQDVRTESLNKLKDAKHLILTSSTLSVKGSIRYIEQALQLERTAYVEYASPYDFSKQGRIFVPSDHYPPDSSTRAHVTLLADQIEAVVKENPENALVLFRSQEMIQTVHDVLKQRGRLSHKTLLAQNISGTPLKIAKQIRKAKEVLVLGADTFWEGVDFPEDELRIVIIARLPFDSPDMPLVKNRHRLLSEQGLNPFVQDMLPRAVMKFKQGIGRLIRSREDKGVWIVLDRRLIDSSYATAFVDSLPKGLSIEEEPLDTIVQESSAFFGQKEKD